MNWTDERVEKLKRLWSEGLSASQIAAQLGGVSRNAVIGKVHRLNLPGRAKAGGSSAATRAAKRPAAAPRATTFASRVATRTVARASGTNMLKEEIEIDGIEEIAVAPSRGVVLPISRKLALTELTERTCKWPIGDPMKDDFHFCGCESADTSPYCSYHAKLAYQPVGERRKAANAAAR
ncbi:MAG: GcrA family cell cycle regulator [Alphaproteobacteria bacterium]|nr:GcrA cell cycle regulator [Rhizobiaceae bacterium]MBU3964063.1 GcrA family cell cycle regulator [Alphaproteobacteria bacterium]MBU4048259.1 GcrA family cell cycle regulator [Alphaproteobacteria bacterium]MBU4089196.1 GcrA family cell cycle regulator [Alphaproteobacteria bacterium]MBU4158670.1 GcrA family cell cycle regulator [Alphaproteobacteria bacterium]